MSTQSKTSGTTARTDPPAPSDPSPHAGTATHHFQIQAAADPSAFSRVMELFALRCLLPTDISCKQVGPDDLHIHIAINDLCPKVAANLAARMRNIIPVTRVVLEPAEG
ncbi:MAG: hypothetical protein OSB58_04540 [Alphaproteobacteria bacterium]|jgi:hypothetical protein|nr:hypothetical protein [Alphaproteobacteria bacterium]